MLTLPFPVWLITLAQAIGMLTAPMIIFVGGFLGVALAPSASLATLPLAILVVGSALSSMPAALLMKRIGRRKGLISATLMAILGSILAIFSVNSANFYGLCLSIFLLGSHMAFVQQLRFAAIEWVTPEKVATTASVVMLGGLIAAWLGPEIGMQGQALLKTSFAGSFVLLAIAHVVFLLLVSVTPFADMKNDEANHTQGRTGFELLKLPGMMAAVASGAVAFGVMSLIMTATPVNMSEVQSYPLEDTKTVIQSHIMAMFLPSLFAPILFRIFKLIHMLLLGVAMFSVSITIAIIDQSYWGYWSALVLLGIGWNFMFVGGTTLLSQQYLPNESFTAQAINDACVFSVQAIMALSAGWMVFNFGWYALNLLAIPLLLLALILIARWYLAQNKVTA